jgi:hypothetical protein
MVGKRSPAGAHDGPPERGPGINADERAGRSGVGHDRTNEEAAMRRLIVLTAALAVGAAALQAQMPRLTPEVRPFVGFNVPTGDQRDLFEDALLMGVAGALELRPNVHLLAGFAWSPGTVRYPADDNGVDMFTYDVGVELSTIRVLASSWQFRPFLAVGAGLRSYAYRSEELTDRTCASGYGAVGTELQLARIALRMEARDNVFCYKSPLAGEESRTRNDLAFGFGLSYHLR